MFRATLGVLAAQGPGSSALVVVSGASGTTRSLLSSPSTVIGNYGSAVLNVADGGLLASSQLLGIGGAYGSSGAATVGGTGGGFNAEIDATQIKLADNESGYPSGSYSGSLAVNSGGKVSASGGIVVGNDATGTGTLRVDGGAVVTGSLQVLTGSAEISAGQITVRAGETIGQGYTAASFNQTGGTHIVNGIAAGGDTLRIGDPVRDNAPSAFALGGGTLVINGNTGNYGSFVQTGGTATMQAVAGSGSVAVGGGTSPASLLAVSVRQSDLSIGDNGALSLRQGSVPVTNAVANLVISGSGRLNLANNNLLIQYPAKHSPVAAVAQHLASGTNAGAWNGPGIDSTQARGALSLGFADSADAGINGIAANSIEVKLTLVGDANLDGRVNFTDLLDLSQHYGKAATAWDAGDFNYDGTVGFDDLLMLAQNFGRTFSPADAVAEAPDRLSQVPEPTLASLLAAGVLVLWPHRRLRVHPANKRPLI